MRVSTGAGLSTTAVPLWLLAATSCWTAFTAAETVTTTEPEYNQAYTSPPINARIQASWNAAPIAVQILETVALEQPESFFPVLNSFVSSLADVEKAKSPLDPSITSKDAYIRSIALLEHKEEGLLFNENTIASIRLSLSLKETSPLIETHYQLYRAANNAGKLVEVEDVSIEWYGDCRQGSLGGLASAQVCSTSQEAYLARTRPFDHIFTQSISTTESTAIIYVDPLSTSFSRVYSNLLQNKAQESIKVVLRWKPSDNFKSKPLSLSGFGVGLDLKRVDYITIDDRDLHQQDSTAGPGSADKTQHSNIEQRRSDVDQSSEDSDIFGSADRKKPEIAQLTPEQINDLAVKATQLITSSAHPLTAFRKLVQDFPTYAHHLSTSWQPRVNDSVMSELIENQNNYIDGGRSFAWLNGLPLKPADIKPFSLLRLMRAERNHVEKLTDLGFTAAQAIEILAHPAISNAAGKEMPSRGMLNVADMGDFFDATDRREAVEGAPSVITYWNDIEKDTRYKHWPASLQNLLQPTYPGQMPQVRRNLINVVLALDMEKTLSHVILAENVTPFISRGLAIRFGSASILKKGSEGSLGELATMASWYLTEYAGRVAAMAFHRELASSSSTHVDEGLIASAYRRAVREYNDKKATQAREIPHHELLTLTQLRETVPDQVKDRLERTRRYTRRLGLARSDGQLTAGIFFVNGKAFPLDESFRANIQQSMQVQMQHIMQQVYFGGLEEDSDVSTYFYDQPTTFTSRNPLIIPEDGALIEFVDWPNLLSSFCGSEPEDSVGDTAQFSLWLLTNSQVEGSHNFLENAQRYLASTSNVRLCYIDTSLTQSKSAGNVASESPLGQWLNSGDSDSNISAMRPRRDFAGLHDLKLAEERAAIVANGRLIRDVDLEEFTVDDFGALVEFEKRSRFEPVLAAINGIETSSDHPLSISDVVAAVTSVVGPAFASSETDNPLAPRTVKRSLDYQQIPGNHTSLHFGDRESAGLQLGVVVDPLGDTSQSWSAILEIVAALPNVYIHLILNPALDRSEMPLKRFYRYSLDSEPAFDNSGNDGSEGVAFGSIPESTLLTLALDTQHAWQAFPKQCLHDLDNIRLADLKPAARKAGVDAVFELSNIIVEGHASETRTGHPPRGLQIELSDGRHYTNTLVMANLGYHQLKANPGLWAYKIRGGRSSEVFEIDNIKGGGAVGSALNSSINHILVTSFEGVTLIPQFRRKPGMDGVDLLDENAEQTSGNIKAKATEVLSKWRSQVQTFFGKNDARATESAMAKRAADINIFTVASGLLYERMAMIMILSVLKHTESTVKFWFINNFLSPSFKAFIPHLAEKYGFEYELVTYTWPAWLRGQKEKQRTIWGYKILFLDVLFPLELDRVIFVDSDQIVRTDLKQLVDLDLKGAPYAYAPMGDDREDMDNYRFWKQGYWAEHLRGRLYHISALYVIDLDRFRQVAAGDRLRGQYQALSADPNSLANLDQDLPNNMQAQLPIYTLDKSWLWCETWCSDEALVNAKTIDLCNNPKTHEPKLARAKRIIPEWTVYDHEIAALASGVAATNRKKAEALFKDSGNATGSKMETDRSAEAFEDEAGQLGQAKEQLKEFVEEGTGGQSTPESSPSIQKDGHSSDGPPGHIPGEL